jgi:hypothetical protein
LLEEAVGTLATWPSNWPQNEAVAEPLLNLVKSGKKRERLNAKESRRGAESN